MGIPVHAGWLYPAAFPGLMLAVCLGSAAPAPNDGGSKDGGRVHELSLRMDCDARKYEWGDRAKLSLVLVNHLKQPRSIKEMPALENQLRYCRSLEFVFRFGDGTVVDTYNVMRDGGDPRYVKWLPLALAGDGETEGEIDLRELFWTDGDLGRALRRCKAFSVTVIVKELRLKSNPVSFNDYKDPADGSDPFADYEASQKRKREEYEAEKMRQRFLNWQREWLRWAGEEAKKRPPQ